MARLTRPTFNHLVSLAALDLTEGEARYLREQLNQQMRAIAELESIAIDPGDTHHLAWRAIHT